MQEKNSSFRREKIAGIARNRTGIAGIGKPALLLALSLLPKQKTLERSPGCGVFRFRAIPLRSRAIPAILLGFPQPRLWLPPALVIIERRAPVHV